MEYVHRHAAELDVVWWVPAERPELVVDHLRILRDALGLPAGVEPAGVVTALGRREVRWLLVLDDAEDTETV